MSAPTAAERGHLADDLATAAYRLRGPLAEANAAATLDIAAGILVEAITEDHALLLALFAIWQTRHGAPG